MAISTREKKDTFAFFAFAAPWIIGFLFFTVLPMIVSLGISFTKWDILSAPKWIGIGNYLDMFSDPLFFKITASYLYLFNLCCAAERHSVCLCGFITE